VDEDGAPVVPLVPADRPGITLLEDWNGFGQRLTATSTSIFEEVVVHEDELRSPSARGPRRGGSGLHQSILLAALGGVIEAAARDLTNIIASKRRVYFLSGTGELPRHDPIVQEQVGRAWAAAHAGALLIDGVGRSLESAWAVWNDPFAQAAEVEAASVAAQLKIDSVQVVICELALSTTAHLLDILGASSLDRDLALDRHWRNARALASHNPYPFKARVLGDHLINGTALPVFEAGKDVGDKPGVNGKADAAGEK
jgi:alkylation response protein AidB-like acyl-CoA dehydrogenase